MPAIPLYRHVYDQIKQRINDNTYDRGVALPSETRLSQEFGVSQITVRRALHELALDGLLDQRQGIGNFVRDAGRRVLVGLDSFTADVAAGRLRVTRSLVLDEMIGAPDDVAQRLQVQPGVLVRHVSRLDMEAGAPIALDHAYTPAALAAVITSEMAASPVFLTLWQERSGLTAHTSDSEIGVAMPSPTQQALLKIGPDIPLLHQREVIRDATGSPLHYIISHYRGDLVSLHGTLLIPAAGDTRPAY